MNSSNNPVQNMYVNEDNEVEETSTSSGYSESNKEEKPPKTNIINLPSDGIHMYPEYVEYRDITVGDEEKLASADGETFATVLNGVIKSVLNDCEFYEQMTIFDREYLIVWLWANNYNEIKEIPVKCPSCEHEHTHKINLLEIPTSNASKELQKPFNIPLSKHEGSFVKVSLATVGDELAAEKYAKVNPNADRIKVRLISALDIGVKLPLAKKVEWVNTNMTGKEFGYVRKFHEHFHYGIDNEISYECPSCGKVTKGSIPFSIQDILYPEPLQSDFEELLRS